MHALPECSAALSVKLGKRPDQKREGEFSNRHELEPTTRLRALRSADNSSIPECHPSFHKSCSKARRGFELRIARFRVWSADRHTTGPDASVWEAGTRTTRLIKFRGGGSCFQLWFAVKSGAHVRCSLAGQDTRLSPERSGFESLWQNIV